MRTRTLLATVPLFACCGAARAAGRFCPASTFKVAHALRALPEN